MKSSRGKGLLIALACYAIWGTLPIFWKFLSAIPSSFVQVQRMVWCCVCVIVFCIATRRDFRRLFKEQIGINPLAFLHQTRIEKSCTLLRSTSNAISTVSEAVGYTSLSCFNQHFQRIMGCTPSVWRKSGTRGSRPSLLSYTGWMEAEILDPENLE